MEEERAASNKWQRWTMLAGIHAFAGLTFGYNTGVIAAALDPITNEFSLQGEELAKSIIGSAPSFGAIFGAFFAGPFCNQFGRVKILILACLITILGAVAGSFVVWYGMLIGIRIFMGAGIGAIAVVCPLYVAEMSPPSRRGLLVSSLQFFITAGIVCSYVIGFGLNKVPTFHWRLMLGLGALPPFALLLWAIILMPESNVWIEEQQKENRYTRFSYRELFSTKHEHLRKLLLGICLAVATQLTGINAIIYYAPIIFQHIFERIGLESHGGSDFATISIGVLNFLSTVVAIFLVDRIGRKPLFNFGMLVMTASNITTGLAFIFASEDVQGYIIAISICTFTIAFALSIGVVFWIWVFEIFTVEFKDHATAICLAFDFGFNVVVSIAFLPTERDVGLGSTFIGFAVMGVLAFLYGYFQLPETKKKSLDELRFTQAQYTPMRF